MSTRQPPRPPGGGAPGRTGPGGPPRQPPRPPSLSDDYLRGGYFDDQGNLRVEVVGDWAKEAAQALVGPNPRQPLLKATQLLNFYHKARIIERKLDAGRPFEGVKAMTASLERDTATAVGRGNAPEVFKTIMDRNLVLALADEIAFRQGFLEHFQSIVGFHIYYDRSGRRQ